MLELIAVRFFFCCRTQTDINRRAAATQHTAASIMLSSRNGEAEENTNLFVVLIFNHLT